MLFFVLLGLGTLLASSVTGVKARPLLLCAVHLVVPTTGGRGAQGKRYPYTIIL